MLAPAMDHVVTDHVLILFRAGKARPGVLYPVSSVVLQVRIIQPKAKGRATKMKRNPRRYILEESSGRETFGQHGLQTSIWVSR